VEAAAEERASGSPNEKGGAGASPDEPNEPEEDGPEEPEESKGGRSMTSTKPPAPQNAYSDLEKRKNHSSIAYSLWTDLARGRIGELRDPGLVPLQSLTVEELAPLAARAPVEKMAIALPQSVGREGHELVGSLPHTLERLGYAFESQISSVSGNFQRRGPVNCLKVMGHVAYVGIKIDQAYGTASSHIGEEFTIIAQDDDQTTNGHRFDNSGFVNASPCQTGQLPHEVLDKGEIVVHTGHSSGDDKPAFPA
jgi:hypothetical protein